MKNRIAKFSGSFSSFQRVERILDESVGFLVGRYFLKHRQDEGKRRNSKAKVFFFSTSGC